MWVSLELKNCVPKTEVMALKGMKTKPTMEMSRTLRLFERLTRLSCAVLMWKAWLCQFGY
jgi:hypothetical protein